MARRPQPRRGVLLLIVLSLLVLFVLIGVTFIVAASHFNRAARIAANQDLKGDPPNKSLDTAMYQIVRGTSNQRSSVLGHSLLEDLYGREGFKGTITQQPNTGITLGNFLTFRFDFDPATNVSQIRPNDFFNGAVLTMITGTAAGHSTRIVTYASQPRPGLKVEAFAGIVPAVGDHFTVNGLPFNGTGAGYNPTTGQLDAALQATDAEGTPESIPLALMPHYAAYVNDQVPGTGGTVGELLVNGGLDESWEAVDYQNVALAKVTPGATSSDPLQITPSFHRPFLINYLSTQSRAFRANPELRRRVILRPARDFHPSFTGSNPTFDIDVDGPEGEPDGLPDGLTKGPWDVDNDGDGVPDSVWIDFGLPPVSAPDGRLYKPLIAPLIVDLDGRLNLNVHGNVWQIQGRGIDPQVARVPTNGYTVGFVPQVELLRGHGFGPAEISLLRLFQDPAAYRRLLVNRYAGPSEVANAAVPGTSPFSPLTRLGLNEDYAASGLYSYGTPSDLYGRRAMYLDPTGNPVWFLDPNGSAFANSLQVNEVINNPYEVNAVDPKPYDNLYSASDLEPVLRRHDADSTSLHSRLISNPVRVMEGGIQGFEKLVTTHSFDVATPAAVAPSLQARITTNGSTMNAPSPQSHIVELIARRLRLGITARGLSGNQLERKVQENLELLVPFEIRRGQKMDLNRLFGNRETTEQTNSVIDDPFEVVLSSEPEPVRMPVPARNNSGVAAKRFRSTLANDYPGTTDRTDGNMLRSIFARQLYTLMMALTDEGTDGFRISQHLTRKQHARRVAQWAINVVEFRDPDAIMTPFEYDTDPFNGWDFDGYVAVHPGSDGVFGTSDDRTSTDDADPDNERGVVWGMEHPEMIITETLAFHDRRVRDEEVGGKVDATPPDEMDDDFDQYLLPEGSLFIELYCTRGRHPENPGAGVPSLAAARLPVELYGANLDKPGVPQFLQLARLGGRDLSLPNPDSVGTFPVWRIAIQHSQIDPNDQALEPQIDRLIWFTSKRPPPNSLNSRRTYYRFSPTLPQVEPGNYLVVGPRTLTAVGYQRSREDPSPQTISLSGELPGLAYTNALGDLRPIPRPVTTVVAKAFVMDENNLELEDAEGTRIPAGCSVSEPPPNERYYTSVPELDTDLNTRLGGTDFRKSYKLSDYFGGKSIDEPLDGTDTVQERDTLAGNQTLSGNSPLATGTHLAFRTAALQRLANPLLHWNPLPNDRNERRAHNEKAPINPYITIDSMPIDLTVFNSLAQQGGTTEPDPANVLPQRNYDGMRGVVPGDHPRDFEFASRERVGDARRFNAIFDRFRNLWNSSFARKNNTVPENTLLASRVGTHAPGQNDAVLEEVVNINLGHTLGELNTAFAPPVTNADRPGKFLGYPETVPNAETVDAARARLFPQLRHSFPTLVWNNRPFVSALELMLVPATSQEGLLKEFTTDLSLDDQTGLVPRPNFSPYNGAGGVSEIDSYYGQFGHLLNFFHSSKYAGDDDDSGSRTGANFCRIFDYVEVPSRFVGTRKWYNPEVFQNVEDWRTPFNNLSRFRDPGRININTILSPQIWNAMGGDYFLPWASFVESRQGFKADQLANYPSEFSNPFRSASGADLVPPIESLAGRNLADATLLRSDLTDADNDGNRREPLLAPFQLTSEADKPYINRKRNVYSRYQAYQKLANLVTTHSNVYAVWLTVGYFELDPNFAPNDTAFANPYFVDAAHPDGYRLGLEQGSDTGQIKRHRAFYIIDRSIPVAFEPGVNHNVDRSVLLRRFIE